MSGIHVLDQKACVIKRESVPPAASLHDLLQPGPVEPGFYVASGSRSMVPLVLDRLVHFLGFEHRTTHSHPVPTQIGKLMWVDSGNSFDPYYMAKSAVRRRLNPTRILRALDVARPFTAFQFQQMLDQIPSPVKTVSRISHLVSSPRNLINSSSRQILDTRSQIQLRLPLVVISDLMGLFYDEEIQQNDVERAFRQFLIRMSFLKKRAIVLGLLMQEPAPRERQHFLPKMLELASKILSPRPLSHLEPPRLAISA